uniref:Uncharacterized protein n=1 Tax=Arundo donax TaxID=35708 RepID=A0A0A9C0E0_ARUDO
MKRRRARGGTALSARWRRPRACTEPPASSPLLQVAPIVSSYPLSAPPCSPSSFLCVAGFRLSWCVPVRFARRADERLCGWLAAASYGLPRGGRRRRRPVLPNRGATAQREAAPGRRLPSVVSAANRLRGGHYESSSGRWRRQCGVYEGSVGAPLGRTALPRHAWRGSVFPAAACGVTWPSWPALARTACSDQSCSLRPSQARAAPAQVLCMACSDSSRPPHLWTVVASNYSFKLMVFLKIGSCF